MMTGASIAYGLTDGGYNADEISLSPLALRILRPTQDGDDMLAKRDAIMRPRVVGEFLRKYDRAPMPRREIARNVLIEMGVPADRAEEVFDLILEGATSVGFVQEIKGRAYVELAAAEPTAPMDPKDREEDDPEHLSEVEVPTPLGSLRHGAQLTGRERRVFVTHGKNRGFIEPLRKLLKFGELEAVVAVERETVAIPIPDKVMADMRSCGAAIIHVDDERRLLDKEAKEHIILNSNVLIEIGAAMALYGKRFILLVKEGVELPSNLSGLNKVKYTGDALDGDVTIRLLEAINDIKNHELPSR